MSRYDEKCKFDAREDEYATAYEERTGLSYAEHASNIRFLNFLRGQIKSDADYKRIHKAFVYIERFKMLYNDVEGLREEYDKKVRKNKKLGDMDIFYRGKLAGYEDIELELSAILERAEE